MENKQNRNNCEPGRKRRNKVSNLSSRLQPDFDIKNNFTPNTAQQDLSRNMKICDAEFNASVKALDPSYIANTLQDIINFLQKDSKELCFPNISTTSEIFLLHIVSDNRYLENLSMNGEYCNLVRQILDTVQSNKNSYKWTHNYEDVLVAKNLLVYRKVYFRDTLKTVGKSTCPTSSSDGDRSIPNKDFAAFKIKTLNITLKFIKNDDQLILEYPEMFRSQAEFVSSLFCEKSDGDVGLGFQSLYSPILNAVKQYSQKYTFLVTLKTTSIGVLVAIQKVPKDGGKEDEQPNCFRRPHNKSLVAIQKVPKDGGTEDAQPNYLRQPHNKSLATTQKPIDSGIESAQPSYLSQNNISTAHDTSFQSVTSNESDSFTPMKNYEKRLAKTQHIIEEQDPRFLRYSLQRCLNFLKDRSCASLHFKVLNSTEFKFLQRIPSLAKEAAKYTYFSSDTVQFLKSIERAKTKLKAGGHILNMVVEKVDKATGTRNMSFHKVPAYDNQSDANVEGPSVTPPVYRKTPPISPNVKSIPGRPTETRNLQITLPRNGGSRAVSKDSSHRSVAGLIPFQAASNVEYMEEDIKDRDIKVQGARKTKLFQDMSTPLESDKAERMMMRMGWRGGALGARGDGITEPIIPVMHFSKGAGLGHVQPYVRTPQETRREMLIQVANLLSSSESEVAVAYDPIVTKREIKLIRTCLIDLNCRREKELSPEETGMVSKILGLLIMQPYIQIKAVLSFDKTSLKLIKVNTQSETTPKQIKPKKTPTPRAPVNLDVSLRIEELNKQFSCPENSPSLKSIKVLAHKLVFLENIKDFLQMTAIEKEFTFDCKLNDKQMKYIHNVVRYVNRKEGRVCFDTNMEEKIYWEIRRVTQDYYLSVAFDKNKFKIMKKHFSERFTDSALPPPVSTDLRNTIIYKNNVVISGNQNTTQTKDATTSKENKTASTVESDEDDVMLIEEKRETIVISDSDSPNQSMDEMKIIATESIKCEFAKDSKDITDNAKESIDDAKDIDNEKDINKDPEDINDSLLNYILDRETDLDSCNNDNDIKELEAAIAEAVELGIESEMEEKFDNLSIKIEENPGNDLNEHIFNLNEELLKLEARVSEVNNNNVIKNNNLDLCINKDSTEIGNNDDGTENLSQNSSKRSRSNSDDVEPILKISKCNKLRKVRIAPNNYPKENITRESVQKFQSMISDFLDKSTMLPLIECHGVQNGGLIYSCHNEKSLLWLNNFISVANLNLKIYYFDTDRCDEKLVVKFKINSFIQEDVDVLINRMELYNTGLDTRDWKVLKEEVNNDFVVITAEVDAESFNFIKENDYSLFLGVDRAQFSIVFD